MRIDPGSSNGRGRRTRRRLAVVWVAFLGLTLAPQIAAARGVAVPDALGPYAVGYDTFQVIDPARGNRTLEVDVWYPVDPEASEGLVATYPLVFTAIESDNALTGSPASEDGPFPLVVFSHGNGGIRFQSFFLTETLASHGFVVAAPDHTGNTALDFLLGANVDFFEAAIDRPQDLSDVIDAMIERSDDPLDFLAGRVDETRIGVTGHSFGGFTSLAMASGFDAGIAAEMGLELPPDFVPIPADPRVDVIAPLAPASGILGDGELARIRVPTLIVGGSLDTTTPIDPDSVRPFELVSTRDVLRIDIEGAVHFAFSDACRIVDQLTSIGIPESFILGGLGDDFVAACGPDVLDVNEIHRITNLYTVGFFQRHLAGQRRYRRFLTRRYAERNEPAVTLFERPAPKRMVKAKKAKKAKKKARKSKKGKKKSKKKSRKGKW